MTITGNIGATAATALNDLKINAEDGSGETAAITISGDIGTNTTAGLRGDLDIGNAQTATLDLEGSFYNTAKTQDYTAVNTGTNIAIKGSSAKFITANKDIRFKTSGVSLANDGTTTIDTGSTGGGNVSFAATNSTGISI